jgi:hypothetical protein
VTGCGRIWNFTGYCTANIPYKIEKLLSRPWCRKIKKNEEEGMKERSGKSRMARG